MNAIYARRELVENEIQKQKVECSKKFMEIIISHSVQKEYENMVEKLANLESDLKSINELIENDHQSRTNSPKRNLC